MVDADSELFTSLNVLAGNGDEAADAAELVRQEEAAHGNDIEQLSIDSVGFQGPALRELQEELGARSANELADHLGLDMTSFKACVTSPETAQRVAVSHREARRLGLTATPSVFVNGTPLRSDHLEQDLRSLIEDLLAEKANEKVTQVAN